MKNIIILLFLSFTASIQAQQLERLISKESIAVVEVSGDQIFDLIDNTDIARMVPPDPSGAQMDLTQYGFDINSKAYYFYQIVDGIGYQNVAVRLTDVAKAEEIIRTMSQAPATKQGGFEVVMQDNMSAAWKGDMAIFTYADFPKKEYTMEDLIAEKKKEQEESGEPFEDDETDPSMLEYELLIKNMDPPAILSVEEQAAKLKTQFSSIANLNSTQSVANEGSYKMGKNNTSSAYFWVKSIDNLMKENLGEDMMQQAYGSFLPAGVKPDMVTGMEAMTGNLIFGKDEIRLDTRINMNEKLADSYLKMYDSKMDKAFLKYFNEDDMLSYMSFTTDMEAALREYPTLGQIMYGSWVPNYTEEMSLAADLISVVLDEEAIGELITGDGLVILHDFEGQEVTYRTIEYDEDFNANEVEKTKIDQIPTFSVMLGSQNQEIVSKLMKLAQKYDVASPQGNMHKLASQTMGAPFDMFMAHNDGIVFLTNSMDRASNYAAGKKNCNLGSHKKSLKNNMFNMYMNATATMDKVSSMVPADPSTIDYIKNNYKEMYITMDRKEGNAIGYDMVIKTNEAKGNSLKLILDSMGFMQGM